MFVRLQQGKQVLIVEFDPQKGRGRVLRTVNMKVPGVLHSGLSADGLTCALIPAGEPEIHISLFSLSGSSDREITVKGWPNARGLEWSSDGKGFYIGSSSSNGCTLLYIDLRGNARVLWKNREGGFSWGTWGIPSPDGRYLAIGERVSNSNVWMVEGF